MFCGVLDYEYLCVALAPQVQRVKEADITSLNKALDASKAALEATRQELSESQAALKVCVLSAFGTWGPAEALLLCQCMAGPLAPLITAEQLASRRRSVPGPYVVVSFAQATVQALVCYALATLRCYLMHLLILWLVCRRQRLLLLY